MNKRAFLALNFFIVALMSTVSVSAKSWRNYSSVECQSKVLAELEAVEGDSSRICHFLDQSVDVVDNLFSYQESLYTSVILPMHKEHKGRYKKMLKVVKRAKKSIGKTLRRAKKAGIAATNEFRRANDRYQELNKFLFFTKNNKFLMHSLWNSARIDLVHGKLIQMYTSLSEESGHSIVQDELFQKELLFVSYNQVPLKRRRYAMVYYMRGFMEKDLKKCKKLYSKAYQLIGDSFALDRLETDLYNLTLLNASVQGMDFYNKEKRQFQKEKRINLILLLMDCFSRACWGAYSNDK